MYYGYFERRLEPFDGWVKAVICPVCNEPDPELLRFDSPVRYLYRACDIVGCEKCMPELTEDEEETISTLYDQDEIREILSDDYL